MTGTLDLLPPQLALLQTTKPRNLLQAGVGSGKTFSLGDIWGLLVSNIPEALGLVGANTYGQLSDSTLVRGFKVMEERFGYKEGIHYVIDKQPPSHFKQIKPITFRV